MDSVRSTVRLTRLKFPIRTVIALLSVLACILLSSTRYNLSIAIVSMVPSCNHTSFLCGNNTSHSGLSLASQHLNVSWRKQHWFDAVNPSTADCKNNEPAKLHWSEVKQGFALGAYYYGFAGTHLLGGRLSERYGPKWITAIGLSGAAILNAFLPVAARVDYALFVTIRVLVGCFHGVVHPALFFMFRNWFPNKEQTSALSLLLIGTALGLILNVPISRAIDEWNILNHSWALLFYGGSLLHVIWLALWIFLATDRPEDHRLIKDKEIFYIRENSNNILETNLRKIPWRQILKNRALYASIVAKMCWSFNHAIIIDNGPSYFNNIAGFGMYQASVYIALVYLATMVIFLFTIPLFEGAKRVLPCSHTNLRKMFQSIVFFGAAVTMFIIPSLGCHTNLIITMFFVNMVMQGFVSIGENPMINEYAGYYSGTVYGIAITFDSFARFLAPIIRGELVGKKSTLDDWNIVFYINGALNVFGLLLFPWLASTTVKKFALKRDMIRQISENGQLGKPVKKELKSHLQNPFYRLPINTNTDDWRQFKEETLVQ